MRLKICLAALAATVAFASPAYAQVVTDTETAQARGLVLLPLTLTRVDDLDFGTVLASPVAGSVTINSDSGLRSVAGGVTAVASNPGQRALFAGAGTANQDVDLTLAAPAFLVSGANVIAVTSMSFDAGGGAATTRTINATGAFQIGVGGQFAIAANQPNGLYTANFSVTAEYQ